MPVNTEVAKSFLSHNSRDKPAVEVIQGLLERGDLQSGERPIPCWFDKDDLRSTGTWISQLEKAIKTCEAAVFFLGPNGLGPVHDEEKTLLLQRAMYDKSFRLVSVLLPGAQPSDVEGFISARMWADFRMGLDDAAALQRLRAFILGEAPKSGPGDDPLTPKPEIEPYRGLEAFEGKHASYFFGRDNEIRKLCGRLHEWPFTAVIGGSGSGKSSVVRAGLQTEVAKKERPTLAQTTTITVRPGSNPIRALADQVAASLPDQSATVTERLKLVEDFDQQFRTGSDKLLNVLSSLYPKDDQQVLLVIDQFEELFTHSSDNRQAEPSGPGSPTSDSQQTQFVELLAAVAKSQLDRLRIVITLRADFFDRCLRLPTLKSLIENRTLLLGKLSDAAVRTVIEAPAHKVGAFFAMGLVARILKDVENQNGSLPLLQHALNELWEKRQFTCLTNDGYDETGGVEGALKKRANATLQNLSEDQREIAKNVFLRLTTLGEGVSDTRRRVRKHELYPDKTDPSVIDAVLKELSSQANRLIVTNDDGTVEVTHEALIQRWDALKGWLAENRDDKRLHDRLRDAANEWADPQHERDPSYLWEGGRLDLAEKFDQTHPNMLTALEREFLGASIAKREHAKSQKEEAEQEKQRMRLEEEQRKERELRRAKRLNVAAILVAVAMGTLLFWGYRAQSEANRKSTEATAVAMIAGLPGGQIPTENEYSTLKLLAEASPAVRVAFIEHLLASPEKAERLRSLFPYILHAVVGLDAQERNRFQRLLLKHGQEPATLPPAINIACAELGALLEVDDPAVNLLVSTNFVAVMEKTTDPYELSKLGSTLASLGKRLPPEQALGGAQQIVLAIEKSTNFNELQKLGPALNSLREFVPARHAAALATRIVAAIEKATDSYQPSALSTALVTLGTRLPANQAAAIASQIVAAMEKATLSKQVSALGTALGSLGENLPAEQAALGARHIVAAMDKANEFELPELGRALKSLGTHLPAEDAAAGARKIVAALEKTSPYWLSPLTAELRGLKTRLPAEQTAAVAQYITANMEKATDPEEIAYFGRAVADLVECLPSEQATAAAGRIVTAMEKTTNSDHLDLLGTTLSKLVKYLPNGPASDLAQQVVAAMEKTTDSNQLSGFGNELGRWGSHLSLEQATSAAQYIMAVMEKTDEADQLNSLSDSLVQMRHHLPAAEAGACARQIVIAMEKTTHYQQLAELSKKLSSLGEDLPAEQAAVLGRQIVAVMEKTTHYQQLAELGRALGSLGDRLPAAQAAAASRKILAAIETNEKRDQWSYLGKVLASLGERLPATQAAAIAQQVVVLMEKTTVYGPLSELGTALGNMGEQLPAEQAEAGARQILAVMKVEIWPSSLSVLGTALASLAKRLPAEQVAAGAQQVVAAIEKIGNREFDLPKLSRTLSSLSMNLNEQQTISVLKSLVCIGNVQQDVLKGLEKKTGQTFDGNVWKAIQWAESQGIDVKKVPRWPLQTVGK